MAASEAIQTISRLTPLTDVLLLIDAEVKPVTPRTIDVSAVAGRALATDAMAPARPASSLALQDGWALSSDETLGAGGYAPAPLARMPPRVEAGQAMPAGTDSIAPIDAVKVIGGVAEVLMPINPGEGVLAAGGDSDPAIPLRRAGERLTATDLAAFAAAGIARVTVREPRFRVLPLRGSGIIIAAARLVCTDIERRGGAARFDDSGRGLGVAMAGRVRMRSSPSAAPAAAATTTRCRFSPAKAGSRCMVLRSLRARPLRLDLWAQHPFSCCRDGSMPRWRFGSWWAGGFSIGWRQQRTTTARWRKHCRSRARSLRPSDWPKSFRCAAMRPRRNRWRAKSSVLVAGAFRRLVLVPADSEGYPAGAPVQVR